MCAEWKIDYTLTKLVNKSSSDSLTVSHSAGMCYTGEFSKWSFAPNEKTARGNNCHIRVDLTAVKRIQIIKFSPI